MSRALRLWLAVVAACCVIAGAVVHTITPDSQPCPFGVCRWSDFIDFRIRRVAAESHRAAEWASLREASDLALAARVLPSTTSPAGEPTVWFAANVSEATSGSVRRALDAERTTRGTWHGRGAVAVLVLLDTAHTFEGLPALHRNQPGVTTRALTPSRATGGRCVSVIRLGATAARGIPPSSSRSLLDACAFFDAFGPPGKAIAAALDSGRYDAARVYLPALPDSIRWRLATWDLVGGLYNPPQTGTVLCATGADSACAAYVMRLVTHPPRDRGVLYGAVPRTPGPTTAERYDTDRTSLFDLLALDLGPERFERFWRSDASLPIAYRAVTGVPITDVVRRVAGDALRFRFRPTGFGMRLTTRWPATLGSSALTLLAIAVLFGLSAYRARRPSAA